ncbi:hypothetical protein [Micrococcus luteus]|uniref:hypothetical protein n=1 Tax=Micrococcus luteus TaxID=1270 RepID=UPI003D74C864
MSAPPIDRPHEAVQANADVLGVVPCPSVVMWRAPAPAASGGGPAEWLHCAACGQAEWFPHGGHGRALLVEALDEHLQHRGGGGRG